MAKQNNKINVTVAFVKPYFEGQKRSRLFNKTMDQFYHTSFHFDGYFIPPIFSGTTDSNGIDSQQGMQGILNTDVRIENPYFTRLIDMRRPSESAAIMAYRRETYLPLTKSPCFKIYNSLRKIVKSDDWKIDYSKAKKPARVADDETLEEYCEKEYPYFDSIENWIYTYAFRYMLVDANALVYILPIPKEDEKDKAEYYRPFSYIVPSRRVIDFKEEEYAIFESERKNEYYDVNPNPGATGEAKEGKIVCIITKEGVWEARQVKGDMSFQLEEVLKFPEPMEYLPAFKMGGNNKEFNQYGRLYESFISPVIPSLDAAAREMSDSDAEVVQHVYSTMWYFSQQNCSNCDGKGKVLKSGRQSVCAQCNGMGVQSKTPYKDMVLKTGTFDGEKMPTPPAGYIVKPTDMVKLQAERIFNHIYSGLSAINMEWLAQSPLNQSGVAKEVDRDELNNFVYGIAYHLVENIVKPIYYFVNEFRYSGLVPNSEEREKMLPRIPVPQKFDLLTENIIEDQLKKAKEGNVDPEIVNQLEIDYINKKFASEPEVRDRLKLKKILDPFPQITIDQKQSMMLSKIADPVDVIISIYLHPFLERAMFEDDKFMEWTYEEQIELMKEYADEKLKAMDVVAKAKAKADADALVAAGGKAAEPPQTISQRKKAEKQKNAK